MANEQLPFCIACESKANCQMYYNIDILTGALDAAYDKIDELEEQVTTLTNALLLFCTAASFEEKQIPGQMSIADVDPCYGCPGCEYNYFCVYDSDPCHGCEEDTCEGCPEFDDWESEVY